MSRRIPGEEKNRYYCHYCGYPCKQGRDTEGSYGESGWNFTTGNTTGDELITNGAFTANTNSWTAVNCTSASVGSGQSGNCARLTRTGGSSQYIYQALSDLTIGQMYRFTAYVSSGSSGNEAFALRVLWNTAKADVTLHTTPYLIQQKTGTSSTTWTEYTVYWRPTETDNVVALVKNSSTAGTMLFDTASSYAFDFKVREAMDACPFCGARSWRQQETY